jgi:exodeoxyribonuclease VII small subunit
MAKKKETAFSLENHLNELKSILDKLQDPKLNFDENLAHFKRGSELIQECRAYLDESEMMVKKLTQGENGPVESDFE